MLTEEDSLFELISRSQSRRIDDQRCSARHLTPRSRIISQFSLYFVLQSVVIDHFHAHTNTSSFVDIPADCPNCPDISQ